MNKCSEKDCELVSKAAGLCKKHYMILWREKNRQKISNYTKEHAKEKNANAAMDRKANPEKYKERSKLWRDSHNEYYKKYYRENSKKIIARVCARYAANPEEGKTRSREWNKKNPERKKIRDAAYVKANRKKCNERGARWYAANREKMHARHAANRKERNVEYKAREAIWRDKNREASRATLRAWKKRNKQKVYADGARRRANKLQATPAWANHVAIGEYYSFSIIKTRLTGEPWHVDHIVPLRSKLVCGLHTDYNLQVIRGADNQSKNNRHWPDMP